MINGTMLRLMFRRHRLFVFLGSLVPCSIGIIIGITYPKYAAQAKQLMNIFGQFARFFGQGEMDMFSVPGAFSIPFQHPLTLALYAILPAIAALAMPAGERGRGVLDQLLATRLERGELLRTVSLFQLLCAPFFCAFVFLGTWIGADLAKAGDDVPWGGFGIVMLNGLALFLAFGGLALVVSTLSRDRAQCTGIYSILVVSFFLIDVAARMWAAGAWLRWVTPYGYLRPSEVVGFGGSSARGWGLAGALAALFVVLSAVAVFFEKRRKSA